MKVFSLLTSLWLLVMHCHGSESPHNYREPFSRRLLFDIITKETANNVVISPASVYTSLGVAFMGAEKQTAEEFDKVLHFEGETKDAVGLIYERFLKHFNQSEHISIQMANRIFIDDGQQINAKFNEFSEKYLKSIAETVKFAEKATTTKHINEWVENETGQKIKNILNENDININTIMLLINAIYFKAKWQNEFEKLATKKQDFFVNEQTKLPIDMMYREGVYNYAEWPELDATAIQIPYSDSNMYMLIVLPNTIEGLMEMEKKFITIDDEKLRKKYKSSSIKLHLPKFKLEYDIDLNDVLENMGLKHAFSEQADFSGMIEGGHSVQINKVKHKAFISVDEAGTEASGATVIDVSKMDSHDPTDSHEFKVDHPFMFAIKDQNVVYFAGHVTNLQ